ncbi:MAG: Mur ligase family protein [bacterium]|nr:Mur ligase family protein [bacterium]
MSDHNAYFESYKRLLSLTNLAVVTGNTSRKELVSSLNNVRRLLEILEHPERSPFFIHVTGTSGKGSVCEAVRSGIHASGATVGMAVSPHTTTYLERFHIGDKLADPLELAKTIEHVVHAYTVYLEAGHAALNFFQLSNVIAIELFHRAKCRYVVLEVGCGGRYDATNVIPGEKLAIITNVDLDHQEILGNTRAKIAYEKAGIIKKGSTVISGEPRKALRHILLHEAEQVGAQITLVPRKKDDDYHAHNLAIAQAALNHLNIAQGPDIVHKLPCRFETVQQRPHIILDGAHSLPKVEALAKTLRSMKRKPVLVFGCKASKDGIKMLKRLTPNVAGIITTRFTSTFHKTANPFALLQYVPKKKRLGAYLFSEDALNAANAESNGKSPILITGSLYLAGEIRSLFVTENDILSAKSSFPFDKDR